MKKIFGTVLYLRAEKIVVVYIAGGDSDVHERRISGNPTGLKTMFFCIDELVYSYYSGELELFLDKIGAHEKAERIRKIPVSNALLLIRLYEIFECNLEDSEEKIRSDAASDQ